MIFIMEKTYVLKNNGMGNYKNPKENKKELNKICSFLFARCITCCFHLFLKIASIFISTLWGLFIIVT